jgi:hypothetical protein
MHDTHDHRQRRGPGPALLLLIPAALIIAKGAKRRRAMVAAQGAGPGRHGLGHHRFDRGDVDPQGGFHVPPWIEQALDTWHARAHASAGFTEQPQADPGTATA